MRAELITAATLAAIELNGGYVASAVAAPKIITVSLNGPCTSNPVNFTDLHDAILSAKDDYSQLYDLQICPSPTASAVGSISGTTMVLTSGTATLMQQVSGTGVLANSFVTAIGAAGTYTISKAATVAAGTTLTLQTPYPDAAQIGFSGTIEGMGTTADSVLVARNCGGCQFDFGLGDEASPEPGITLEVKNFHVEGTLSTGGKEAREFQVIADGYIRFDNVDMTDAQDGILANRWANYAQAGYGVIVVSGCHFDNDGSPNGPSHNVYLTQGYDLFGGTITVPLGIVVPNGTLVPGTTILQNDTVIAPGSFVAIASISGEIMTVSSLVSGTIYPDLQLTGVAPATMVVSQKDGVPGGTGHYYVSNSQTVSSGTTISSSWSTQLLQITAAGNTSGDVAYGYGSKFRPHVLADVENNNYVLNVKESSSGAIQDGEGGTLIAVGNTISLGPQTGLALGGIVNPPIAMAMGGLLGDNNPQVYILAHNTIVDAGSTKLIVVVESLSNTTDLVLTDNTLPLPAQMTPGIMQAFGTVASGNVYADSSPVTPFTQLNAFYQFSYDPTLDFRGNGTPQTVTLNGTKQVWGGNALLTVNPTPGQGQNYAVLGGPGGSSTAWQSLGWLFTAPNSTNTINLQGGADINIFDYGNDTITFNGTLGRGLASFAGSNTTVNCIAPSPCNFGIYAEGGTITTNSAGTADTGPTFTAWPGVVVNANGSINQISAAGATINANITANFNGTLVPYVFTLAGGVITGFPRKPVSAMTVSTYEDSPGLFAVMTLGGTNPSPYQIGAAGGATVYAGPNKVTIGGNGRMLGPPPLPINYHVQSSAPGSSISSQAAPFKVYLDGPGVVTAGRANTQNQPDYLEVDSSGSGTVTISQGWRAIDTCALGTGVTVASATQSGANETIKFSSGGTVIFNGSSNVQCGTVTVGPSPLAFVQSTPLIAPITPPQVVGVISGGNPPYSVADTTHFIVSGNNLDAASILNASTYATTISDGATAPSFTSIGTCDNGVVWQVPSPPAGTVDLNGFGLAYCSINVSNATVVQLYGGASLNVAGSNNRVFTNYASYPIVGHGRYGLNGANNFLASGVFSDGSTNNTSGSGNVDVIGSGNTLEFANTFASYHGAGGNNWLIPDNGGTWIWRTDNGGDQRLAFPDTINIYPVLTGPTGYGFACSPSTLPACFSANIGQLSNSGSVGAHSLPQASTVLPGNGPLVFFNDCAAGVNTTTAQMFSGSGAGSYAAPTIQAWPPKEAGSFNVTGAIAPGVGTLASYGILSVTSLAASSSGQANVVAPGMTVGGGASANTVIVAYNGGSGGTGSYLVNNPQTVASATLALADGPPAGLLVPSHPQMVWFGGTAINIEVPDASNAWIPQLPIVQDIYDKVNGNPAVTVAATVSSGKWNNGSTLTTISAGQTFPGVNEPIVSLHYVPPTQANCTGAQCPAANTDTMSFTFTNSHGTSIAMSKQIITWYGGVCPP